jgi:hypothetical protein
VDLLHYFDYAKGTPALITWVAHNFFYFTFNAGLWLLFRGLAALLFARWSRSPPPVAVADHAAVATEGAAGGPAKDPSVSPANAASGGVVALPPPTPPPDAADKAKAE